MSASNNLPSHTKQWLLRKKPYGFPVLDGEELTFVFSKSEIPKPQEGQVLLKLVYLSNDPAQRSWIYHFGEATKILVDQWKKGRLVIGDESQTVIDTAFEDIPKTWMMLYTGGNTEKLISKLT